MRIRRRILYWVTGISIGLTVVMGVTLWDRCAWQASASTGILSGRADCYLERAKSSKSPELCFRIPGNDKSLSHEACVIEVARVLQLSRQLPQLVALLLLALVGRFEFGDLLP